MFDFKKIIAFTDRDLKSFGRTVAETHKRQILKGIDADGNQFTKYSKVYAQKKRDGEFKKQISKQTSPVNLTLTGQLLKNFRFLSSSAKKRFGKGELFIKYGFQSDSIAKDRGMNDDKRSTSLVHGKKTKRVIASTNSIGPDAEQAVAHIFASQIAKNLQRLLKTRTKVYRV